MKQLIPFVSWIENFIGGFSFWFFFPLFNLPLQRSFKSIRYLEPYAQIGITTIIGKYRFWFDLNFLAIRLSVFQVDFKFKFSTRQKKKLLESQKPSLMFVVFLSPNVSMRRPYCLHLLLIPQLVPLFSNFFIVSKDL